ncbi:MULTISPECIES: hypothetical protein [Hyphomonas]|uniref:Uncharacterized protein n=1 Tax=Hyphomonas adhaerens TaxID=81029 RepID=A0A3B9H328_9PROT|nr:MULTISPECIES: hypothetical protein [Hyphomonas]MBB40118.1 hypothetical protein [Hyphomonas sp.]HAE29080.1 hypothetical protein [Hyphomonas adhaerens]
MKQARAVLRLVSCENPENTRDSGTRESGARRAEARHEGSADHRPADTSCPCGPLQGEGDAVRGVRQDLLKEWMGSHTRILGLWLDRLLEEGDDADLVSMIHRQHAWLSMMQARMERG